MAGHYVFPPVWYCDWPEKEMKQAKEIMWFFLSIWGLCLVLGITLAVALAPVWLALWLVWK